LAIDRVADGKIVEAWLEADVQECAARPRGWVPTPIWDSAGSRESDPVEHLGWNLPNWLLEFVTGLLDSNLLGPPWAAGRV